MAKQNDSHIALGVGLGVAAVAAAAAGYFLYGTKEGAKRRAKMKGWMLKMKGEVLEKMEDMKEMNEETYHNIVDTVSKGYAGMQNVDPAELAMLTGTLKKYWKNIHNTFKPKAKKKSVAKKGGKMMKKSGKARGKK